jgi:hypothetical protein
MPMGDPARLMRAKDFGGTSSVPGGFLDRVEAKSEPVRSICTHAMARAPALYNGRAALVESNPAPDPPQS